MPKIEASTIERYQSILDKDPSSQVFAPLAEAYRELGQLEEAKKIVNLGVQRHPHSVSGLVTQAKILRDLGELEKALGSVEKASQLSSENILAHQLKAELLLAVKRPKDALKAFKMVLFMNPNSKSAQKAVQKLESLTADEYEDDVFSMTKLPEVRLDKVSAQNSPPEFIPPDSAIITNQNEIPGTSKALDRVLSLIDAFIVRNDIEKARALLKDSAQEFGDHSEIKRRMATLQIRYNETDEPIPLKPLVPRDELVRKKKLEALELMLCKIEEFRAQG